MDVRGHIGTLFHLDKCIGCHTCSIACKNVWTDRAGADYMWWNNVETKPGTGYPTKWEDQSIYGGGWEVKGNNLKLKLGGKASRYANLFHNPKLPTLDDYYEPWTYDYQHLFTAPAGDDQPTARPISKITGEYIDLAAGPNWDDDLSGSPVYAENDPNLSKITDKQREELMKMENIVFFYLPRICNHCLNPGCVAACPQGAIYKRGEDGIVLINQEKCRGWRMCVAGCPYKKTYYNWKTGKSEKCILCFPRIETGQAPMCFHSCVGRIRYLGAMLYDADKIESAAKASDHDLVEKQRDLLLDPFDPEVIKQAKAQGIADDFIEACQKSPVYKYVKKWKIALPLHSEFRTLAMLYYVPPLLPDMASVANGIYDNSGDNFFVDTERNRLPLQYMASLFSAGNTGIVKYALNKQIAVRYYRRWLTVGDVQEAMMDKILKDADTTREEAEEIFRLTSLAHYSDRFVIPPSHREESIEEAKGDTYAAKGKTGIGFLRLPSRG